MNNRTTQHVNQTVPVCYRIPGGFLPDQSITITGEVPQNSNKFAINLQCGYSIEEHEQMGCDIALHVNFRYNENAVVRNHLDYCGGRGWGVEERHVPDGIMPVSRRDTFTIMLKCSDRFISIFSNLDLICDFNHRLPCQRITHVSVMQDVIIWSISFGSLTPGIHDYDSDVTPSNLCLTDEAKRLCIYDIVPKLRVRNTYDIGSTYKSSHPKEENDFWFYFQSSPTDGGNYLLNLFVCCNHTGRFEIGVSRSADSQSANLTRQLDWYFFETSRKSVNNYIKTFCFTEDAMSEMNNEHFYIEVRIKDATQIVLNQGRIRRIKMNYDFGAIYKFGKSDCTIIDHEGGEHPVHKIVLAANSSTLREIIRDLTETSIKLDINNEDLHILLQYLYTGTINDDYIQDYTKLLNLEDKYGLKNLFLFLECAIITVDNAIELAIIAEKHKLHRLQENAFSFISDNVLTIMEGESWKKLHDVAVTKKLFAFVMKDKFLMNLY